MKIDILFSECGQRGRGILFSDILIMALEANSVVVRFICSVEFLGEVLVKDAPKIAAVRVVACVAVAIAKWSVPELTGLEEVSLLFMTAETELHQRAFKHPGIIRRMYVVAFETLPFFNWIMRV
jgi:hypothetical protein